jgi:hypothetical protein
VQTFCLAGKFQKKNKGQNHFRNFKSARGCVSAGRKDGDGNKSRRAIGNGEGRLSRASICDLSKTESSPRKHLARSERPCSGHR